MLSPPADLYCITLSFTATFPNILLKHATHTDTTLLLDASSVVLAPVANLVTQQGLTLQHNLSTTLYNNFTELNTALLCNHNTTHSNIYTKANSISMDWNSVLSVDIDMTSPCTFGRNTSTWLTQHLHNMSMKYLTQSLCFWISTVGNNTANSTKTQLACKHFSSVQQVHTCWCMAGSGGR